MFHSAEFYNKSGKIRLIIFSPSLVLQRHLTIKAILITPKSSHEGIKFFAGYHQSSSVCIRV